MKWPWSKRKGAESVIPKVQKETEEAKKVAEEAAKQHRQILDQQPEVWKAIHRSQRLQERNHFREDLEEAIMRRRTA